MIKLFISQSARDKSNEKLFAERNNIIVKASEQFEEAVEVLDSYFKDYVPKSGCIHLKFLSKALETIADADILVLGEDWEFERDCRLELNAAIYYDIPIYRIDQGELIKVRDFVPVMRRKYTFALQGHRPRFRTGQQKN